MNFDDWFGNQEFILKPVGLERREDGYFKRLQIKIDDLRLNDGMKEVYAKMYKRVAVEKLYLFYTDKMIEVTLNGYEIAFKNFYFANLNNVAFSFKLNEKFSNKLILNFNNTEIHLNPVKDSTADNAASYNNVIERVYYLINNPE